MKDRFEGLAQIHTEGLTSGNGPSQGRSRALDGVGLAGDLPVRGTFPLRVMRTHSSRIFFILYRDWTWWVWLVTAILLACGLGGFQWGFQAAISLTIVQVLIFLVREKGMSAFPVQLRVAYLLLLLLCLPPAMNWLYWLPTVGTFALNVFGYCLMARFLSLLPWNRREPWTLDLLGRTFFSRPRIQEDGTKPQSGCAGGLCTIEAQVRGQEGGQSPVAPQ